MLGPSHSATSAKLEEKKSHSLARGKYLTKKRGHLTASAAAGFKLWGGMFPFEILRLPRFVHRNLLCSATFCNFKTTLVSVLL